MTRGPSPLKVEAADPAIAVQNLADQIEPPYELRFHRPEIDLFKRHSARRHFCIVPSSILHDRKREFREQRKEGVPVFSRQLGDRDLPVASRIVDQRFGKPLRQPLRQRVP